MFAIIYMIYRCGRRLFDPRLSVTVYTVKTVLCLLSSNTPRRCLYIRAYLFNKLYLALDEVHRYPI